MHRDLTPAEQFDFLTLLDFLSALFTETKKEHFTRDEILVLLNNVRNDEDFICPLVAEAYELAVGEIELP